MMQRNHLYPAFQALIAAVLFGASAPISKLLLGEVEPIVLASFLYFGAGTGILLFKLSLRILIPHSESEASLKPSDYGWLIGAVISGGVLAPIVLLISLRETPAATASLLLNFESVATSMIALVVFQEAISRRAMWAIVTVTLASVLLSWDSNGEWGISPGAIGVLGACVLWGIENNLTRNISAKDPLVIVLIKGLGAGTVSLIIALALGNSLPSVWTLFGAMIVGSLSYGLSIVLYIRAMRGLGAARTSAVFGMAPLAGVLVSLVVFRDSPSPLFYAALPLVTLGILLLLTEKHQHTHQHRSITHEHYHRHDDGHHNHDHADMTSRKMAHSHEHTHEPLEHSHPHLPDTHHRHNHTS